MTTVYGIKNCDTMKKAFKWLDDHNVSYDFHDYKKSGVNKDVVQNAIDTHGWENVINRRGTTWRNLSDDVKNSMKAQSALDIACDNPSIIKRPLLVHNNEITLGFSDETYKTLF